MVILTGFLMCELVGGFVTCGVCMCGFCNVRVFW